MPERKRAFSCDIFPNGGGGGGGGDGDGNDDDGGNDVTPGHAEVKR